MSQSSPILRRSADALKVIIAGFFLLPLFFTILVSIRPETEPVTKGKHFLRQRNHRRQL